MAEFIKAIPYIIDHEIGPFKSTGGLVDDPDDAGGVTKWGISLRYAITLPLHLGDIDGDGDIDADDIRAMKREDSERIYKMMWDNQKYERIYSQEIATKVFDFMVNMGPRRVRNGKAVGGANLLAQRAVRSVSNVALVEDGLLGPISFATINNLVPTVYLAALRSEAAGYYRSIATGKRIKYLKGWLNRAYWQE